MSGPSGGTLQVLSSFTPFNQAVLSDDDTDLGSGGVVLLPDLPAGSAHQHLLVQCRQARDRLPGGPRQHGRLQLHHGPGGAGIAGRDRRALWDACILEQHGVLGRADRQSEGVFVQRRRQRAAFAIGGFLFAGEFCISGANALDFG
jgi:hypothetical protein